MCRHPENQIFCLSNDNVPYFNHLCWKNHHKEMICCLNLSDAFSLRTVTMCCIAYLTPLLYLFYKYSHSTCTRRCSRHWTNINLVNPHSSIPTHEEGTVLQMTPPGTVRSRGQFKVTQAVSGRARSQTQSGLCP